MKAILDTDLPNLLRDRDRTIAMLVEMVTLLLGEDPKFNNARHALFAIASESKHLDNREYAL